MPASVVSRNRKAAAEAKEKGEKGAPVPPVRSSSIRVSARYMGREPKVESEKDKLLDDPSSSTLRRPRRTVSTGGSFTSRDLTRPDSKVGKIMSKFSNGKLKEEEDGKSSVGDIKQSGEIGGIRSRDLHSPRTASNRLASSVSNSSKSNDFEKNKVGSPSILKKIMDKTPYRKSTFSRPDATSSPMVGRRANLTVLKTTTKGSKC